MKPIIKRSKSVLTKIRQWKPFKVPEKTDHGHIFMNFSLRMSSAGAILCDSEQEFMNISLQHIEIDTILRPSSKMIIRTFVKDFVLEDITQLSLFPKVRSIIFDIESN